MIRIVLVDDEQLVRSGLRMILESAGDIEIVGEAADGGGAVEQVRRHRPDAVLMDIRMPAMDGLTATREITALPDPPRIIMLTTFELDEYGRRDHVERRHPIGAVGRPSNSPVVGSRPSNMAWNPATDASPSSARLLAPAPYHRPGLSPWPDRYASWSVASSRV